jgi:hypothetical protein
MFLSTYLVALTLGALAPDQLETTPGPAGIELSWADAEDRVQGAVRPARPHEGAALQVTLRVGSFEGAEFRGPVTLTLRRAGEEQGVSVTVTRGEVGWAATFHPAEAGAYWLDVSFRTTRLKVLHAALEVSAPPIPRAFRWGVLLAIASLAIGWTARRLFREGRGKPTTLPER